ncbi:MAG: uridine kinase family protein, partial [Nocardioidaceae bacterium]
MAACPVMDVSTMVQQAVEMVRSAPALLGDSRLLCVDGPAGSGKTTLALKLVGSLKQHGLAPETLHMDNLYEGWTGLDNGLERRILTQVLAPLSRGDAAKWQRYDWEAGRFGGGEGRPPPDMPGFEGRGVRGFASSSSR